MYENFQKFIQCDDPLINLSHYLSLSTFINIVPFFSIVHFKRAQIQNIDTQLPLDDCIWSSLCNNTINVCLSVCTTLATIDFTTHILHPAGYYFFIFNQLFKRHLLIKLLHDYENKVCVLVLVTWDVKSKNIIDTIWHKVNYYFHPETLNGT